MKVYVANSLFSEADRDFNEKLVKKLRGSFPGVDFYLPQENMGINDKSVLVTSRDIALGDRKELKESDLVIAVLDGNVQDPGVCCEVGIAYGWGMPVYGLLTDIRFNNDNLEGKMKVISEDVFENNVFYVNLFLKGIIDESGGCISRDKESLIEELSKRIKKF